MAANTSDVARSVLGNRPGTVAWATVDHAGRVAAQIIGRASSPPRNPLVFVQAAIPREEDPRDFLPTPAPPPYQRPATRPVPAANPAPRIAALLPFPYPVLPPVPSPCHAQRMTVVLALDPGSLFAARWKG